MVALQQAEQQLPQVGRRLPGDAEEKSAASLSVTSRLHAVAHFSRSDSSHTHSLTHTYTHTHTHSVLKQHFETVDHDTISKLLGSELRTTSWFH